MLEPRVLMDEARQATGLSDFGDAPLQEGLERLCIGLETEARLNDVGMRAALRDIRSALVERLKIEDYFARNAAVEEQQIVAPIMIAGMPRTGTTALSHMLSRDPANRSIRRWEAAEPVPPADPATDATDARRVRVQKQLDEQWGTPELKKMNPIAVDDPTESLCFYRLTFQSVHFAGFYHMPGYHDWVLTTDMVPVYEYLKRVLKILQLNYPGRRWNLKYPFDTYFLEEIATVFPDAALIWTHRDPLKSVPSSTSLIHALRHKQSDAVDKVELGLIETERRVEQLRRGLAYDKKPGALPIHHIQNADLVRDPIATIRKLYAEIGSEVSREFEAELGRYREERPMGRFGGHEYSLEEFGLEETEMRNKFQFYTAAVGL